MARFDVYANPSGLGHVLDIQADILSDLNTRTVVPLLPLAQAPTPAKRLNPIFEIGTTPHVMVTQFMAAVPRGVLGNPITNLARHDTDIANAIDMLLIGF